MKIPRKYIYIGVGLLALGALAGAIYATVGAETPPPPPVPEAPPVPPPQPTSSTYEEEMELRRKYASEDQGEIITLGPERSGTLEYLAGKVIQLPPDAYVSGHIDFISCIPTVFCPETPIITIRRGKSVIAVSAHSGVIVHEQIEPGEEGAFDFLKEALT